MAFVDLFFGAGIIVNHRLGHSQRLLPQPLAVLALGLAALFYCFQGPQPRAGLWAEETSLRSVVDYRNGHDESWEVRVRNSANFPITMIGWSTSCSDLQITSKLPLKIPAHSHADLQISYRKSPKPLPNEDILIIRAPLGETADAAREYSVSHQIQILSDLSGRVEFSVQHTHVLSPELISVLFP